MREPKRRFRLAEHRPLFNALANSRSKNHAKGRVLMLRVTWIGQTTILVFVPRAVFRVLCSRLIDVQRIFTEEQQSTGNTTVHYMTWMKNMFDRVIDELVGAPADCDFFQADYFDHIDRVVKRVCGLTNYAHIIVSLNDSTTPSTACAA